MFTITPWEVSSWVKDLPSERTLSGLLAKWAQRMGLKAVILYEIAPYEHEPSSGQLIPVAIGPSADGIGHELKSLLQQISSIKLDEAVVKSIELGSVKKNEINFSDEIANHCFIEPISFISGGFGLLVGCSGEEPSITKNDFSQMTLVVLPFIIQIRNQSADFFIEQFEAQLSKLEHENKGYEDDALANFVAEALDCIEVGILIGEVFQKSEFRIAGARLKRGLKGFTKPEITKSLALYALDQDQPVSIYDGIDIGNDLDTEEPVATRFPRQEVKELIEHIHRSNPSKDLAQKNGCLSSSLLLVPMRSGEFDIGAICCLIPRLGQQGFSRHDCRTAKKLAEIFARYVMAYQNEAFWNRTMLALNEFNDTASKLFADSQSSGEPVQQQTFLDLTLDTLHKFLPQADAISIRMPNPKQKKLRYVAQSGDGWNDKDEKVRKAEFNLNSDSWGAKCFLERRFIARSEYLDDGSLRFPDHTERMYAPILLGDTAYGVLDIRARPDKPMPNDAELAAIALGQQLGLHLHTIDSLRKQKEARDNNIRATQDLAHQLKTPLIQARDRITDLSFSLRGKDNTILGRQAYVIKKTVNKAYNVTESMDILAKLHDRRTFDVDLKKETVATIEAKLRSMVEDAKSSIPRGKKSTIYLNLDSFTERRDLTFYYSPPLFEQCVDCVLDNAIKYSFPETDIFIKVEDSVSFVSLSFLNQGPWWDEEEIKRYKKRGVRGATQEGRRHGSGLGMWLTDELMKVQDGLFLPLPTARDGNRVYLKFSKIKKL